MQTWKKLREKPSLWQQYFLREKIIKSIRNFFYAQNFHEVETPLLVPSLIPESYLDVFETYLIDRKDNKKRMFLTASPEASIKKLIGLGLGSCFEITKSFRNRETGSLLHNPEFTILEWYRVGADYFDMMKDCEELFLYIYKKIKSLSRANPPAGGESRDQSLKLNKNNFKIIYQNQNVDLTPPWERISVEEALKKHADISFEEITQKYATANDCVMFAVDKIAAVAKKKGYSIDKKNTWEEVFHQIFLNEVEPHLGTHGKPTIIYDYPKPLAGLAKTKDSDLRLAERFELYIGGLEIGDGYSELTDYGQQKKRFKKEIGKIKKNNKTPVIIDKEFLKTLKIGLPECAGIAMGVDRLVMLFTNKKSIQETLLFPIDGS